MSSHALTHLSLAAEGTPFWVSHRKFHTHTNNKEKKDMEKESFFYFF